MRRSASLQFVRLAISLLLSLIVSSCTTPSRISSQPAVNPPTWPTPTQLSDPQPNSNGSMTRANVQGTGIFVTKGVRQHSGLKWKFKTTDRAVNTTPAIQGSSVYFGRDGVLYAVDRETGIEKWNRKLDNQHTSAPAIAGDVVYIGGWEELYAFSTDTGELKWIFQPESGSDDTYYSDPVVYGGTVYFGGWHNLYALDSHTGQEKWKLKLSGNIITVPTLYDGLIYVGTYSPDGRDDTYLYALDSMTGQEKWKLKATGDGIGGAVAVTDGVAYVSTTDDGLLALDAKGGQEIWRYDPGSGLVTAPAAAYGQIYISDQGSLYAVDAQTGKEKWRHQGSGGLYSDPVIADGIVYFTTTTGDQGVLFGGQPTGYLHAVDVQSGQELWEFSVTGITSRAPAVSDGTVYFGSEEGTLYAIK